MDQQELIQGELQHLRHIHDRLERTRQVIERGALAYVISRWTLDKLGRSSAASRQLQR